MSLPHSLSSALWRARALLSLQFAAVAFVVLACASVLATEAINISEDRGKAVQNAWQVAANLTRSLGQHAEDTVRIADAALVGLSQRLDIDGTGPEVLSKIGRILVMRLNESPALADFVIVDETGRCLLTAPAQMPAVCNLADSDYFEYLRTHTDADARLGHPVRMAGSGAWVLPLARRFNHADGSFGGVIATGIALDYFQRFYDTFDIGTRGAILLALRDGTLLVRRPFAEKNVGRDLSRSAIFRTEPERPAGNLELPASTDGIVRLNSYRRLEPYPLVMSVALASDDVLETWRATARAEVSRALSLIGIIGALGGWLAVHVRKHHRLEVAHRDTAAAFRLLAENSSDLIVRLGPGGERLYVSPASRELLGYDPEELIGHRPEEIVHPDDRALWAAFCQSGDDDSEATVTYRVLRKDGAPVWVEASRRRLAAEGGSVLSVRDVTQRKQAEDKLADANQRLQVMASEDALTGLANRRQFDQTLEAEARRAARDGTTLSLIMIDIDRFKAFNDRYGHPEGDRCLREVAAAIKRLPGRPGDFVARYGGEEMAIVLPNTPLAGARKVAAAAREAVRALRIRHDRSNAKIVTVSLGVATTKPGVGEPAELIRAADQALYAAKQSGRDAVRVAEASTAEAAD